MVFVHQMCYKDKLASLSLKEYLDWQKKTTVSSSQIPKYCFKVVHTVYNSLYCLLLSGSSLELIQKGPNASQRPKLVKDLGKGWPGIHILPHL